jgi:hypothetical protein
MDFLIPPQPSQKNYEGKSIEDFWGRVDFNQSHHTPENHCLQPGGKERTHWKPVFNLFQ